MTLESREVDTFRPDSDLTVGGGCSHYEQDATAGFECVPDA